MHQNARVDCLATCILIEHTIGQAQALFIQQLVGGGHCILARVFPWSRRPDTHAQ